MYSLLGYEEMVDDGVRMEAYTAALRGVVTPGSVVIDIGAGTGVMSLLACRFGAKRVYAIEPDDAIVIARQNAIANGMADRITFHQGLSTELDLPEKADVVVADLRGILPLFRSNIHSLIHARRHLVAPGGVLIPKVDRLWMAVFAAADSTRSRCGWNRDECAVNLSAVDQYLVNTPRKNRHTREELLTPAAPWAALDFSTIESPDVENSVDLTVIRRGTAAGISMWFETELRDGVGFSNGPGEGHAIYGMLDFPLTRPVDVEEGDAIEVAVKARFHNSDYLWQWDTRIRSRLTGQTTASFQQSTFFAAPKLAERLFKAADKFRPSPTDDGRIAQFILGLMDGVRGNAAIAESLVKEFPGRFPTWESALTRVGQVCLQYC